MNNSIVNPYGDWKNWETTLDGMFHQRVQFYQHKKGYRFSLDPVLLSSFVSKNPAEAILDLGCGCGVIPILLAELKEQRDQYPKITGLEIQPSLVSLAKRNVILNQKEGQISIVEGDIRYFFRRQKKKWDLITFNPPYCVPSKGQVSPHPEKAKARHELEGSLVEFVKEACRGLHAEGRMAFVYPVAELERLVQALQEIRFRLRRLRFVHSSLSAQASLVLLEASSSQSSLSIEPPLILYEGSQIYTSEASSIFSGINLPSEIE